ncbi:PREDICTED: hippocalcin-like protein 1 [Polistes canadensis]|uniref:hippocalcin-like protein 1 n=1 Tax=Polistes canadensis TaxID=91411 RepID=UPI000718E886|nr:PREDICTED: hippocalcin-like protein 1 [Polistes canadensis]
MSCNSNLTNQDRMEVPRRPSLSMKMQRSLTKVKKSIQRITENFQDEEKQQTYVLPERLSSLMHNTGFSKEEIQRLYRAFKQYCPRGTVTTNDIKPAYAKLFPLGDSAKYAQMVFNNFDTNKDGIVTFGDLLLGIATIVKGTNDEKLKWIFQFYDLNGDGCISKNEMTTTISAIYEMINNDQTVWNMVNNHVDKLFEKMDINKDGMISIEEFIASCKNDTLIQNQLTEFNHFWW